MKGSPSSQPPIDAWADRRLDRSVDLAEIVAHIDALADADNLAAVIVHFNDTYLIEERLSLIPGLARIAGTIHAIRRKVLERLGSDLTLVCHGGDYLGPSRLSRQLLGAPMVELLRHCGVTVATVGNHEFDHDPGVEWDVLRSRLLDTRRADAPGTPFRTVLSNLQPPAEADRALFERSVPWPPHSPRFLVCGYAGEQTQKVALAHAFLLQPIEQLFIELQHQLVALPGLLAIVVLTHASRDEDRALQRELSAAFPDHAIYVLGGHDHHMQWTEPWQHALLLKCLSNGRSLGVIAVPKDGLAAMRIGHPRVGRGEALSREDELRLVDDLIGGREEKHCAAALVEQPQQLAREAMQRLRSPDNEALARAIGDDFLRAFEQRMVRAVSQHEWLLRTSLATEVHFNLASMALSDAKTQLHAVAAMLDCTQAVRSMPVSQSAYDATARWCALAGATEGGNQTVVNFGKKAGLLDATDTSLRAHSTDFGNFVSDALRRATGVELALVNAGALRADCMLPPRLTRQHLRDVLLYDGTDAGARLALPAGDVRRMLAHAVTCASHGAFLQVSDGWQDLLTAAGERDISVVIVRHMIAARHDEDGYCAALAADGESWQQAQERLLARIEATGSLEAWICAGAAQTTLSRERRLVAQSRLSPIDAEAGEFMRLVDRYRDACRAARLDPDQMLQNDAIGDVPRDVFLALQALVQFADRGFRLGIGAKDVWFTAMWKALTDNESNYATALKEGAAYPIRYQTYLQNSIELLSKKYRIQVVFRLV